MATVPSFTTWTTGQVVTAAQLNTNVRDAGNFFVGQPLAVLRNTAVQSIPSGFWTAFTFDTEDANRDGGHSNISNATRYTAQTAGWYLVVGTATFASNATGLRGCAVIMNGSTSNLYGRTYQNTTNGDITCISATTILYFNVTDYCQIVGFQSSGGSINTSVINNESPRMNIFWISS